jgi:uncharacterized protein (TIGR03437 family)
MFVAAGPDRLAELKSLPGVIGVVPARRYEPLLDTAVQVVHADAAWGFLGGKQDAGSGMKIAIVDTGIDQNHPAFQDPSLPVPAGFPLCGGAAFNCADFTNSKVIVARSYVAMLAAGSLPDPSADSRPDDYTPRDHVGHGTAVASAAGAVWNNGGLVGFNGVAPKAYLGNYKIYGSPQVNDFTTDQVIVQAANDAFNDGMDILSFSSGGPALFRPLDTGAACQQNAGVPCDIAAYAFEELARQGMVIVAAAGNKNGTGLGTNTFNTISSPADAPGVITVGATTNAHAFAQMISILGAPQSDLQNIPAIFGDGPWWPVTAPLRDVEKAGNDGYACAALPAGSMSGAIAFIERGPESKGCTFDAKVTNAQIAGAIGVIFYEFDPNVFERPRGLTGTAIPSAMVSHAYGLELKNFIASNPKYQATMDPALHEFKNDGLANFIASFSSLGPAVTGGLKPDVLAPGTEMYMAAQTFDPYGSLYSSNGYTISQGTSFSTPMVSGAAALVKQANPSLTPAQIKSAIVDTANQAVTVDDVYSNPVDIRFTGAGLLNANTAVNPEVTAVPATLSFGFVGQENLPQTIPVTITNISRLPQPITLAISPTAPWGSASGLSIDTTVVNLPPGGSRIVNVTFAGPAPAAGVYSGFLQVQTAFFPVQVPYMYIVGDGVPRDMIPVVGFLFAGSTGQTLPGGIAFMLTDQYGVPVANTPVMWTPHNGITLRSSDSKTNSNGIAVATPTLGPDPGNQAIDVSAGGLTQSFSGRVRDVPTITDVQDAATYHTDGFAPGSYIALFDNSGKASLSDFTDLNYDPYRLPLAIDYTHVSFDLPSAKISAPGHLYYVSGRQINVQVPWEVGGETTAKIKTTIGDSNGNVVTIPISTYAPGFFETDPGVVAARDADYRVINAGNPARRGTTVQLYANGLGPVKNQPGSGEPALARPLSETTTRPMVTIGDRQLTPAFSGLVPSVVGLYQMNVTIPSDMPTGNQPVMISIGGKTSKPSGIMIQ